MESLKKIINDDALFSKALDMSKAHKVLPFPIHGKNNNNIYNSSHFELSIGLDLINKALKKPSSNILTFFSKKTFSPTLQKLYKAHEDDVENNLILSLIILQTEKEKGVSFKPTVLSV